MRASSHDALVDDESLEVREDGIEWRRRASGPEPLRDAL
jgi:hypothetical protein